MDKQIMNSDYFEILSNNLDVKTWDYTQIGIANARNNTPYVKQTIKALADRETGQTCVVVSGGPSLKRRDSIERLRPILDKVTVVAADGSMGHCLRADIIPDYIVSVDPDNPEQPRIIRWFGDHNLNERKLSDDYFRRQDLDEHFNDSEIERNQEQIRLVDAAGPKMIAALCTSAAPDVRDRCIASGMDIYWWNPLIDDATQKDSVSRELHSLNGAPCMNAGGNVGTAAFILASRVLRAKRVIMVGMDFSYYADTPLIATQYYREFEKFMSEEEIPHAFKTVHNPHLDEDYYTDPAYYWYRKAFLELARNIDSCEIINATEGGILFGEGIQWMSLDEVISEIQQRSSS